MFESTKIALTGYMPVGDIIVISLSIVMSFLLWQTHINKNTKFRSIMLILFTTWLASFSNVIYETMAYADKIRPIPLYIVRLIHNISLTLIPCMYIQYLHNPLWIPGKRKVQYRINTLISLIIVTIIDILGFIFRFGFYIENNTIINKQFNLYAILYLLSAISTFYIIIKYRSRVIRQIFLGLLSVSMMSALILSIQFMRNQVSYTCVAYFLPVLAIIFMFHSNPYDIKTGAVSGCFLNNELSDAKEKNKSIIMLSIEMSEFAKASTRNDNLQRDFYSFCRKNIKKGILYHFPNERLILTLNKDTVSNYQRIIDSIINNFKKNIHMKYNLDYKIIIMETHKKISDPQDYLKVIDYIEQHMTPNEVHTVTENDIKDYFSANYILRELEDIVSTKNLNDERVLVYCQPVFNIITNSYDTAEALMRLKLEKTGMVFPDQFIPIAEQYNMIHTLSMIILNKTCRAVREILDAKYEINRVSVNFSAIDIKYESFCDEIQEIIEQNNIPYDKIAVEITESRCESDFNLMRQKVMQLQELGIKFYLDDFGTGYSNFERIMEIPFNIIKFDRSMLIESVKNDSSKFMVSTFADMFNKLNYAVLFEGVEDDRDETHCVNMNARYLQGYKYSKPIPIEQLINFLDRQAI